MKKWAVQLQDDSVHIVRSTVAPRRADYKRVVPADEAWEIDEGSTIDIEESVVDGETVYQAVQNAGRKSTYDADKADKVAADVAFKAALLAKRDKIKGKKVADMNNIAEVKQTIQDILDYLGLG